MEIIKRYVYAVTKQLPEKERAEVEKELELLIYDMMEEYPDDIEEMERATAVIKKLGNPDDVASKYRFKERYLIGPKYFNKYVFVLKVVSLSVFLGITIATFFGGVVGKESISKTVINYIPSIFIALLQGAAWVTVIFALFEYKSVDLGKEDKWSIKELPALPNKKALISRGESIFSIIFSTIFFSVLYFAPQLISIYYKSEGEMVKIPIFAYEQLDKYKLIIILIFLVTILQETLKIIWGRWTTRRAIIFSFTSVGASVLTALFFTNMTIWNSDIADAILKYTGFNISIISNIIILVVIVVAIIEITTSLYKGIKYGD